jgi:hypothetical protein
MTFYSIEEILKTLRTVPFHCENSQKRAAPLRSFRNVRLGNQKFILNYNIQFTNFEAN